MTIEYKTLAHRENFKQLLTSTRVYIESCADICAIPRDTGKKTNAQTMKMLSVSGYGVKSIMKME